MSDRCLIAAALVCLTTTSLSASSDAAWEQFRDDVRSSCVALVEQGEVEVDVNPFGSDSYGAAILRISHAGLPPDMVLCIYDKQTGAAELTAPFPAELSL